MPQIVPGIQFAPPFGIFYGSGSPNSSSDQTVQLAQLSSLYLPTDAAGLWQCTTAGVWDNVSSTVISPATWTQITVP